MWMLTMGEAVHVGGHVICAKSLHLLLNIIVNQVALKNKVY